MRRSRRIGRAAPSREALSNRQSQILDFLRRETRSKGYPPSVREIGAAVGLSSSSSVHAHLRSLERGGFLKRQSSKSRALEIIEPRVASRTRPSPTTQLPLVGTVAAGTPILAEENIEQTIAMPASWAPEGSFLLRVKGESMVGAGILSGDLVVVRPQKSAENGEIVVALIDGEATVKRFYLEDDNVRLQPDNPSMEPIISRSVDIVGKVVSLLRSV